MEKDEKRKFRKECLAEWMKRERSRRRRKRTSKK